MTEARATQAVETGAPDRAGRRLGHARRGRSMLAPLLWVGPAVVLIGAVVIWPAVEMVRTSLLRISFSGTEKGFTGLDNYARLLANPALPGVMARTAIWVFAVVAITMVISLFLGQLLNQQFPGRRLVRIALIVPWAASVVVTAMIWRFMFDNFYGVLDRLLIDLHFPGAPIDWLGNPTLAFACVIAVAVFVSLPFTTVVIIAGLQGIPDEILESARVDGASAWRSYRSITLPLLRPALLVASLINLINVFNSFPIIWIITNGGPGYETDTTTTYMYKLAFRTADVGQSAALAVVNFAAILIVIAIYLRTVRGTALTY